VRSNVQENCHHLLVDEFQDTNPLQFEWVQLFSDKHRNVTIVGDEDQSIYGWRGAVPDNMMEFADVFPNTKVVRLEQNYRSTTTILTAANEVINNNPNRFKKKLWTRRKSKQPILRYDAHTCQLEANFVSQKIIEMEENNLTFSDFAVLYRTNAQSRVVEEAFGAAQLPFKIYGGTRFYARLEIKHILAYLRLIVDSSADEALRRVINVPPRSIGERTVEIIEQIAADASCPLWDAMCLLADDKKQSARVRNPLNLFIELMNSLRESSELLNFSALVMEVIESTKIRDYYLHRPTGAVLTECQDLTKNAQQSYF